MLELNSYLALGFNDRSRKRGNTHFLQVFRIILAYHKKTNKKHNGGILIKKKLAQILFEVAIIKLNLNIYLHSLI